MEYKTIKIQKTIYEKLDELRGDTFSKVIEKLLLERNEKQVKK